MEFSQKKFEEMRNALQHIHNITLNRRMSEAEAIQHIHITCDSVLEHDVTALKRFGTINTDFGKHAGD